MNCFEARREFNRFWRHTSTPQVRAALVGHLKECTRCDHAFRLFALTAPVMHSESEPGRTASSRQISRAPAAIVPSHKPAGSRRAAKALRPWRTACAAILMLTVAGLSAYKASVVPQQSIDQSLTGGELTVEPASEMSEEGIVGQDLIDQDQPADLALQNSATTADTNDFAG
jgi:hypothetical protein